MSTSRNPSGLPKGMAPLVSAEQDRINKARTAMMNTADAKKKAALRRRMGRSADQQQRMRLFLKAFSSVAGNISAACERIGISRKTYFEWMKTSENFRESIHEINEAFTDFAESKIKEAITRNNVVATMFYLKCKAKDRGYIERAEVTGAYGAPPVRVSGDIAITIEDLQEEVSPEQLEAIDRNVAAGENIKFSEGNHAGVARLRTRFRTRTNQPPTPNAPEPRE